MANIPENATPPLQKGAEDGLDPASQNGVLAATHKIPIEDTTSALKILDGAVQIQLGGLGEHPDVLDEKARHSQYDNLGKAILQREKDTDTLKGRSQQAVLHLTFTEMRLKDVETELQKLRQYIYHLPEAGIGRKRKEKLPVYRHVLQRSSFYQFRITSQSFNIPLSERPALEVLVSGATKPQLQSDLDMLPRRVTGLDGAQGKSASPQPVPERLRIRSGPLIIHLERVTGRDFRKGKESRIYDGKVYRSGIVILRPFKVFVAYEKEIRESIHDVEAAIKQSSETASVLQEREKRHANDQTFDNEDLLEDLKLLIEFIEVDLKPIFDLRDSIRNGMAYDIEYHDLWHLFNRGDFVTTQPRPEHAYRVINCTGGRDLLFEQFHEDRLDYQARKGRILPTDGFTIDCWSLGSDGSSYVPKLERFSIRKFVGRQPIVSLPVYPLRLDPNAENVRKSFIEQGRRFLDLTLQPFAHKMLTGKTLDEPSHEIDAQVIIDMTLAINTNSEWRPMTRISEDNLTMSDQRETREPIYCEHTGNPEGCCGSDIIFKDLDLEQQNLNTYLRENSHLMGPRKTQELEEDEHMLLPHWVYGFVLRSRQWVTLRTSNLSEVKFENNFDDLILPAEHKSTVKALVKTHESARAKSSPSSTTVGAALDLVRGKGTGLIILLHGEPGVGKTSTAECVADNTKRPLFPITCGDIGETAMEVETKLHHNFKLAHKWGCVLLLDEADVFLARRSKMDLRHNAVTSVFLRSLEYYAGILFLTTNRVGGIDPAFKSRIHMSLFYPRLDFAATRKLYEVFIKRTRMEQERTGSVLFRIKEKEILRFGEKHFHQLEKEGLGTWNGRQIRNAFQTAIALTEHDSQQAEPGQPKPTLGKAQFQIVADGSKEFDRYLISTLGAAEADIAIREGLRADQYLSVEMAQGKRGAATSKSSHKPLRPGPRSARNMDCNDETDSNSDDNDDESYEDDEDDGNTAQIRRPSLALPRSSKKTDRNQSSYTKNDPEYEEFLRWKQSRK